MNIYHHVVLPGCDLVAMSKKLDFIFERIQTMPTAQETKQLVSDAVAKEIQEVKDAIKKAVETALAADNIPQDVVDHTLAAIDTIVVADPTVP